MTSADNTSKAWGSDIKSCLMLVPTELEVCLSSECNMACRYCYYRMDARGPQQTLRWIELREGLDKWLSLTASDKVADLGTELSLVRKVDFAGREPFSHYELLKKAIEYLRRKAGNDLEIGVYTNGYFLNRKNVAFLLERRVKIVVSLDGAKKINDLNRVFIDHPEESVFDAVASNLRSLTPNMRSRLVASSTTTSETVSSLLESVKCLLELGFGEISLGLDMFEIWNKKGIKRLRKALCQLKSEYKKRLMSGNWPYSATYMFPVYFPDLKSRRIPRISDEIALGYDGYFYPCTVPALGPESRKAYRIGHFRTGIDLLKLRRELIKVDSVLGKHDASECAQCPVGGFFDCKMMKKNVPKFFKSDRKISDIFREEIGGIITLDNALNAAIKDGKFGDLNHPPVFKSDKEISTITVEVGHKGKDGQLSLSAVREGIDFALYSPGNEKEIRLKIEDPAGDCDFIFTVSAYALMKSEKLGKKLRLIVCFNKSGYDKRLSNFIREHQLFLEIVYDGEKVLHMPSGISPEFVAVIVRPGRKRMRWNSIFKSLLRSGFVSFSVESSKANYKEFSSCLGAAVKQIENNTALKPIFLKNLDIFLDKKRNKTECPFNHFLQLCAKGVYGFFPCSDMTFVGKSGFGFCSHYSKCSFSSLSYECKKCSGLVRRKNLTVVFNERFLSGIFEKIIFLANKRYLKDMLKMKQIFSGLFTNKD
ncbi:MAG: radical SAM protein [Elusimicrobia bacterium]|nr:radical SAM protein [Elusimicrobiota bacterium]